MSLAPSNSSRLLAWLIDTLLMSGASQVPVLGWVAAAAYWLSRDALFNGQSVGKRVMGLRVVIVPDRRRCGWRESVLRNLLWLIPIVNGAMLLSTLYYLLRPAPARHWGDRLGQTDVVRASPTEAIA